MGKYRLLTIVLLAAGIRAPAGEPAITSPLPPDQLAKLRQALPEVTYPKLAQILTSPRTFWYDHVSMKPSYQAAILESPPWGVNSNDKWFNLVAEAVQPTGKRFYDPSQHNFHFPFAATAGADDCPNLTTFNFLWLPLQGDKLLPVVVAPKQRPLEGIGLTMASWGFLYPVGAVVGEALFITTSSGDLLPVEIRTRTRSASGWASNAFRPFPTASLLSRAIQARRPNWRSVESLRVMVEHLEDDGNLVAHGLHATQLPGIFDQDGALDVLPDFGDPTLVTELLTQTPFSSAYGAVWKSGRGLTAYAASTQSDFSIVPKNYTAGIIEVSDDACMRCHQETGRPLQAFGSDFQDIVLYGEMWGRDGIFSFHPFDESLYSTFWYTGTQDNRQLNPNLVSQGVVANYDASAHAPPLYPPNEIVGGKTAFVQSFGGRVLARVPRLSKK